MPVRQQVGQPEQSIDDGPQIESESFIDEEQAEIEHLP